TWGFIQNSGCRRFFVRQLGNRFGNRGAQAVPIPRLGSLPTDLSIAGSLLPHVPDQPVERAVRHLRDSGVSTLPVKERLVQVLGRQRHTVRLVGGLRQERTEPVLLRPHRRGLSLDLIWDGQPLPGIRQVPTYRPGQNPLGFVPKPQLHLSLVHALRLGQLLVESDDSNSAP